MCDDYIELNLMWPKEPVPSSIFVYGHSSSGKKHIVTSLLKNNGLKYLVFNCIESYSPRILFETILGRYSGEEV
ncbi:hypothetical protein J437_LFUL012084 [Ladona fulva]|uniref:Uncharacterized protein n=1 Tax=Ladona fulva TaxID=123851 RepID=A0A8K0JWJ6_LADFU|nr:hypothetical protein J437_LFUL012084 [Ladona fulva]